MHGIYAHARFNDRDSWSAKPQIQCLIIFTIIKLATTVGHFLRDLDFANVYMA